MIRARAAPRTRTGRARARRRGRAPGPWRARRRRARASSSSRTRRARFPHHRQVEVGEDVARECHTLDAASRSIASARRGAGRSRSTRARTTSRPPTRARRPTITPASSRCLARPESDRDQRLADRDDHDQPVPLDEVRGLHAPAAHDRQERRDDSRRRARPARAAAEPAVDESRHDDQRRADERRGATRRIAASSRGRHALRARTASGA